MSKIEDFRSKVAVYDKNLVKNEIEIYEQQCKDYLQLLAQNYLLDMDVDQTNLTQFYCDNFKHNLSLFFPSLKGPWREFEIFTSKAKNKKHLIDNTLSRSSMGLVTSPDFSSLFQNYSLIIPSVIDVADSGFLPQCIKNLFDPLFSASKLREGSCDKLHEKLEKNRKENLSVAILQEQAQSS